MTYHVGTYTQDALPTTAVPSVDGDETSVIVQAGAVYKYNTETQFAFLFRAEDVSSDDGISFGREFTRNSAALSVAKQF